MNVAYEKLDNVRGKLTVKIEENDYADKVKAQLKEIRKSQAVPGFRPGKAPASMIEKKYGEAVKYDIVNKEIGNALFGYIRDNKLHVLGNPVPAESNQFDLQNKDFDLEFTVGLAPEFDTHVNKELHVPYYNIEVSDEMIDTQDKNFRMRLGKQQPVEQADATAVIKGVITELDENGEPKAEGIVMENGIVSPNYFKSEEQKELFKGAKVGDVIKFNPAATCDGNETEMSSMLNIDKNDVENHKGDFSFKVTEIIGLVPAELNEEYYKQVFGPETEVKTEEEYRQALKNMIANALVSDSNYRFTIDAREAIQKAVGSLELPDEILKDFLRTQNEALNETNIDAEYDSARPALEWELIRDAVAEQLDVKVENEDVLNTARMMARQQFAQYGMNNIGDDVVDKYAQDILKDKKAAESIFNQTRDMKLYAAIKEAVTTDDKNVTVEEFNALFTPAELGENAEEFAKEMDHE